MAMRIGGFGSAEAALQAAEGQVEVRVLEGQDKVEELAFDWIFNMGRKYEGLKCEKQDLEKEKLLLKHQVTELKVLHEEEWKATLDKANSHICLIVEKIRIQVNTLKLFLAESEGNTLDNVSYLLTAQLVLPITNPERINFYRNAGAEKAVKNSIEYFTFWIDKSFKMDPEWEFHPLYKVTQSIVHVSAAAIVAPSNDQVVNKPTSLVESKTHNYSQRVDSLEAEVTQIKAVVASMHSHIEELKGRHKKALKLLNQGIYWEIFDKNIDVGNAFNENFAKQKAGGVILTKDLPNKINLLKELNHGYRERMDKIMEQINGIVSAIKEISTPYKAF